MSYRGMLLRSYRLDLGCSKKHHFRVESDASARTPITWIASRRSTARPFLRASMIVASCPDHSAGLRRTRSGSETCASHQPVLAPHRPRACEQHSRPRTGDRRSRGGVGPARRRRPRGPRGLLLRSSGPSLRRRASRSRPSLPCSRLFARARGQGRASRPRGCDRSGCPSPPSRRA
jgi:hypothetical protein